MSEDYNRNSVTSFGGRKPFAWQYVGKRLYVFYLGVYLL